MSSIRVENVFLLHFLTPQYSFFAFSLCNWIFSSLVRVLVFICLVNVLSFCWFLPGISCWFRFFSPISFFLLHSTGLLSIKIRISRLDVAKLVTHKTQQCSLACERFSVCRSFSFATFCNSFILRIVIVEREKDIRLKTTNRQQAIWTKSGSSSRIARIHSEPGSQHWQHQHQQQQSNLNYKWDWCICHTHSRLNMSDGFHNAFIAFVLCDFVAVGAAVAAVAVAVAVVFCAAFCAFCLSFVRFLRWWSASVLWTREHQREREREKERSCVHKTRFSW